MAFHSERIEVVDTSGAIVVPERISLLFLPGLLCDERLWQDQAASLTKVAAPLIADLTLDESIAAMARRALAAAPN